MQVFFPFSNVWRYGGMKHDRIDDFEKMAVSPFDTEKLP